MRIAPIPSAELGGWIATSAIAVFVVVAAGVLHLSYLWQVAG
jgi:hypothetical protein